MRADVSGKTKRRTFRPSDRNRAGATDHVSDPCEQVIGFIAVILAEALGHGVERPVDSQQDATLQRPLIVGARFVNS